jgi:hypothetical protein
MLIREGVAVNKIQRMSTPRLLVKKHGITDKLYRWFNDSTRMPGPPSARTALLKEQRLDDQNNRDLAESTFSVTLIRLEQVEMSKSRTWHGNLAITFLRNTLGIPRCLKT